MAAAAEARPVRSETANFPPIPAFPGNSEFALLVACCAHSSDQEPTTRIRKILSRQLDWQRMLSLVDHHRVVPQVYGQLSAFSQCVPAQHLHALRSRYQDNARRTLWFTAELVRILSHLESLGIKALPYKGPVLAKMLYREVTERQFSDLDILILPADVPKAKAALLDLGYKPGLELAPHQERAYLDAGYEYPFHAARGTNLLELQWRILPRFYSIDFDVANFFDRADEVSWGGRDSLAIQQRLKKWNQVLWNSREAAAEYSPRRKPWVESGTPPSPSGAKDQPQYSLPRAMRTLRGEDLLLVLCVHAAKHVWIQLSWLCDIAQLAKSQPLDWNTIQDQASRLGIERIVNLNLLLAQKLLGSALPPVIQKRLREDSSTTVLADEIQPIIERSAYYDTQSIPYFRLMMRLRERWQDQARFLWRLTFTPSLGEWSAVQLPKPLQPLYRLARLWRLAKRLRLKHR
jgi:Uncharacterised nucleotidyltransferase